MSAFPASEPRYVQVETSTGPFSSLSVLEGLLRGGLSTFPIMIVTLNHSEFGFSFLLQSLQLDVELPKRSPPDNSPCPKTKVHS